MNIQTKLIVVIFFMVNGPINAMTSQSSDGDFIVSTEKFDFYSNYWINLHHYLYHLAKNQNTDDNHLSQQKITPGMSEQENKVFTDAIDYYRSQLIKKDLLFNRDMYNLKLLLSQKQMNHSLADMDHNEPLKTHLNSMSPIYLKYFWAQHDKHNRETINKHIKLIQKKETAFLQTLAQLSSQPWPDQRIRIDMSYLANWAGAYTTVKPKIHAVISSLKYQGGYDFIELLWHESSHGIIAPNEFKVAAVIKQLSQELNTQPPKQLWHGILFYLAGATTQKMLAEEGIEYDLYMVKNQIFSYQIPYLTQFMQPYVEGQSTMYQAIKEIMLAYQKNNQSSH